MLWLNGTEILAKMCNMVAGKLIHSFGDAHIYENHIDQVAEQMMNDPLPLPKLDLSLLSGGDIDMREWNIDELVDYMNIDTKHISKLILLGYDSHKSIKGELSTGTGK